MQNLHSDFEAAVRAAMKRTGDWLEQRLTEEISDAKWNWPTQPSPRDIVDSGRLRASMQRESRPGREAFSWPVSYAVQAHEGAILVNGRRLPARPWTRQPLAEAEHMFKEFLRQELWKS